LIQIVFQEILHAMIIPKLETKRLLLREWRESDFDSYAGMMADADVATYLSGTPMGRGESWRQMASLVGHWALRGYGIWAVEEKDSGLFVGRVGLWYPAEWPGIEVGWTVDKSHWGKGYAPEAGAAAMAYGFQQLPLEQIISVIHRDNKNSISVAKKLGEQFLREQMIGTAPCVIYGITRETWSARSR
jgi:RimJ/RimL family protein N-acetyltransferase